MIRKVKRLVKHILNSIISKFKVNIYKNTKKLDIKNPKKVSVIIPNYNYSKYLNERIDSVLFQTYPIYEIIILDDCSTDDSVKTIKDKMALLKDNRIRFIKNKTNSGVISYQWQKGFKEAKGDYVWIAEADDSCNARFLENVIKGFDNKKVLMSYCDSKRIDETNHILSNTCTDWYGIISRTHWSKDYISKGSEEIKSALSITSTIPNVSAVVFKNDPIMIKLLDKSKQFIMSGDWCFYFNLLQHGDIAYCAKSLNYFRRHSDSTSTASKDEIKLKERLIIQKEAREYTKLSQFALDMQKYTYANADKKLLKKYKDLL